MDYDYDQLFPGRFLKSGLFQGKAVTLTIADVKLEELPDKKGKDGKRKRGVLSFRESELELVLNRTNGECLKGMFGRNTADWKGKRVTFYPREVEAFGKPQLAIRVLGSPDIARDLKVELQVGTSVSRVTMKKTDGKKKAAPPPAPVAEDPPDMDPETGEVPFEPEAEAVL